MKRLYLTSDSLKDVCKYNIDDGCRKCEIKCWKRSHPMNIALKSLKKGDTVWVITTDFKCEPAEVINIVYPSAISNERPFLNIHRYWHGIYPATSDYCFGNDFYISRDKALIAAKLLKSLKNLKPCRENKNLKPSIKVLTLQELLDC